MAFGNPMVITNYLKVAHLGDTNIREIDGRENSFTHWKIACGHLLVTRSLDNLENLPDCEFVRLDGGQQAGLKILSV